MEDPSTSKPSEQIIFRCVNCITEIRDIRFTCKHNECEDVHLCGLCFCMQAELGKHKKTHPYEIWNEANFKLFKSVDEGNKWLCIDEQRLFQAVERYGHGNWQDVGAMVPGRTVKQVEDHYNDYYVDGNIGTVSWKVAGYSSEKALVRDVGIPESSPKQTARNIQLLSNLEVAEMNYMPSRDEFYKEYDNEAEQEISLLVFQEGEDELDRKMKLALIDGCQRRLQERSRRKNVASEFGLLHLFLKHQDAYPGCEGVRLHKGETRFRSEICANLKLFLQYMTFDELISFLQNLTSQIELKARIRDLCRARKHGVTRLDAMPHFEIARQHREKYMQGKEQMFQDGVADVELAPEELQALEKDVEEYPFFQKIEKATGSGLSSDDLTDMRLRPEWEIRRTATMEKRPLDLLNEREQKLCADLRIEPRMYMDYKLRIIFHVKHEQKKIGVLPGLTSSQMKRIVKHLASTSLSNVDRSKRLTRYEEEFLRVNGGEDRKESFDRTEAERTKRKRIEAQSPRQESQFTVTSSTEAPQASDISTVDMHDKPTDLDTDASSLIETKFKHPQAVETPVSQSSSPKSVSKASLLAVLEAKLSALKPSITNCSPAQLLQLKSQVSPQSFAIIQLLAVSKNSPRRAPAQSSSSSSASSTECSSNTNSDSTTSPEGDPDLPDRTQQDFFLPRLQHADGQNRRGRLDSARLCLPFPPSNINSASSSRIASSSIVIPPPSDHDYYSAQPQNGSYP